jgi:phospholipid/cholesterol/gamma-HCH transport system substrate-binding protein
VKRAIAVHRKDFIAVTAMILAALVVVGYILLHQPAFTLGHSYYTVKAEFQTGAAVTAGQGQAVTVAGVQVGQVGGVELHSGRALITMNLYKDHAPIYRNATVLLRPRTPLKDMYLSLDPGTPSAGAVPDNGLLPVANTSPDIDTDQILSSLDSDTRAYLLLLLAGGAQAFQDPGTTGELPSPAAVADLQGTFKRFAPLGRDTVRFSALLSTRNRAIRRSIHNLQQVAISLGSVNNELASLIRASNTNFQAISSEDNNLQQALTLLPGTLQITTQTLGKAQGFAKQSTAALSQLSGGPNTFAEELGPALQAAQPLFRDTTSVITNQLLPFSASPAKQSKPPYTSLWPLAHTLSAGAAKLSASTPKLASSIGVLNALFNLLAYQPKGQQSYLFWGSWLSHIAANLAAQQDTHGPIVRGLFMASCPTLNLLEVTLLQGSPSLGPLLALLNAPDWSKINSPFCPAGGLH